MTGGVLSALNLPADASCFHGCLRLDPVCKGGFPYSGRAGQHRRTPS